MTSVEGGQKREYARTQDKLYLKMDEGVEGGGGWIGPP